MIENPTLNITNRDAVTYGEIEDKQLRVQLRVGDLLMSFAVLDPIFQRELRVKEIATSDFSADDGTGLFPQVVVDKLESVGGKGAAIRVLSLALQGLNSEDNSYGLNGDRAAVIEEMILMHDRLRTVYRTFQRKNL